jgi:purine-nucleoside phosphorylase
MLAYTGYYKNKQITVMAHGMGMPSIGIYSYELFKIYKVNTIIRIGSAGGFTKDLKLGDVVVAAEAYSKSIYAKDVGVKVPLNNILKATSATLRTCIKVAQKIQTKIHVGKVLCNDVFYTAAPWQKQMKLSKGLIAVEMEAFALYANAIKTKKHALCLLTVSDSFVTNESMSPEKRQTSFNDMVKLALETAIKV